MHPFEEANTESVTGVTTKVAAALLSNSNSAVTWAFLGNLGCAILQHFILRLYWYDLALDDHDLSQSWRNAQLPSAQVD